jgi:hypothetical protein
MTHSSTLAADQRAAQAALTRPLIQDFDRFLLIDDTDEDRSEICTILRECSPRGLEVLS